MTDGIKITGGDGALLSTVTTSSSAVTFNNIGFQKITFDGDTFDSMDDFWDHVRTLRAENARLAKALSAAEALAQAIEMQADGSADAITIAAAYARYRKANGRDE